MPKRSKRKTSSVITSSTMSISQQRFPDGEVIRNFFAVVDDVDPREALKHLIDMFQGKLDSDVVTMIFTECGYNVNQALENLISLTNDTQRSSTASVLDDFSSLSNSPSKPLSCTSNTTCLPIDKLELNSYIGNSNASEMKTKNKERFSNQSATVSNHNAFENFTSFVQEEHNAAENVKLKTQEFHFQSASINDLKYETQFSERKLSSLNFPIAQPYSLFSPKPFILPNTSEDKPINPDTDGLTPHNIENAYKFITPVAHIQKKFNGSLFSYSSNFKPRAEITPMVHNSRNADGNDYTQDSVDSVFTENFNSILKKASCGLPILIILRGLPGSGKSTLAKQLKCSGAIFSTDDFFFVNGRYVFDWTKLSEAHEWNRKRTIHAVKRSITPIIIDNTNTESWEMVPYIKLALNYQYEIQILEPNTSWKFKPGKLAKKNRHNIPREKIKRMLERYEDSKNVEKLIESYRTTYMQEGKVRPSRFCKVVQGNEREDDALDAESDVNIEKNNQPNSLFGKRSLSKSSPQDQDNVISLEAVIHQADELDDSEVSSTSGKQTSVENELPDCSNPNLQTELIIGDLDDLKLLTREDSEEPHNINQEQTANDSCEEVSSWEAITELDKDFYWTTDPSIDNQKAESNEVLEFSSSETESKSSNLQEIGETLSVASIESSESSISSSAKTFVHEKLDHRSIDHDEDIKRWIPKQYNENSITQSCINVPLEVQCSPSDPKPQKLNLRNRHSFTPLFKTSVENENTSTNNESTGIVWETVDDINLVKSTWDDKPNSETKILDTESSNKPKQQRSRHDSFSNEITNKSHIKFLFSRSNSNFDQLLTFSSKENSTCDWELPTFPILPSDSSKDSPCKTDKILPSLIESGTQTEPNDFVLLNDIETNPFCVSKFKLLKASVKLHAPSLFHQPNNIDEFNEICEIPCFEKSTSTDDIPENMELSDKVKILNDCFPGICEDDLKHFLELCHGDDTWLSNILLEWGYKYNNPNTEQQSLVSKETKKLSSSTKNRSCLQQSNDTLLNTWEGIESPEWSLLQQLQDHNSTTQADTGSTTADWSCAQQPNDTWERIRSPTTSAWLHIQQPSDHLPTTKDETASTETVWPYVSQSNTTVLNSWEGIKRSTSADWPLVHNPYDYVPSTHAGFTVTDWSDVQQPNDTFLNTWEEATDWSQIQQVKKTISATQKETRRIIETEWSPVQLSDDLTLYTEEEVNNSVATDWSDAQQFDEYFPNSSEKSECGDNDRKAYKNIPFENEQSNLSSNKEENDLTDEQKRLLNNLVLTLNSSFAAKLQEIFGSVVADEAGPLTPAQRKVVFDFNTAQILYNKWKGTIQNKLPEEDKTTTCVLPQNSDVPSCGTLESCQTSSEPLPLSEIMDMEYALQLHKEEKMKSKKHSDYEIAIRLKRQELYKMFPGVDTIALDDIFEANNCSLDHTVLTLEESIGKPAKTSQSHLNSDPSHVQMKQKNEPDYVFDDWISWVHNETLTLKTNADAPPESTISKEAANFRDEAVEHYQYRQECMNKAHAAYRKGMTQLASFYAQEGSYHAEKFKEANKKASELITEERNRSLNSLVLDLHGLYVKEAIPLLGKFLRSKKKEITDRIYGDTQTITVLTGRGSHSLNGAKLRPSVIKYLKGTGYRFSEMNTGIFSVNMADCPQT